MKGSRVASRIVIFIVLVVVFGIGVSFIILQPMQGAQSQVANAPTAAASRAASDLPAPESSAAVREAAAAPAAPAAQPGSGADTANPGSDTKESKPKL
jgi:hypothetical protein